MFSRRLPASLTANRLARLRRDLEARGLPVVDLTESNPTRVDLDYPGEEIRKAVSHPGILRYDPSPSGRREAREAVVRYYQERAGGLVPEDVVLTSSTSEGYGFLFKLLADPGETVLVPQPSYPLFEYLAGAESLLPVGYPLVFDGEWRVDLQELRRRITPDCRVLVLVSPNNPTGSVLKRNEWESLLEISRDRDLVLICDEVFRDYVLDPAGPIAEPIEEKETPLFVLNGLSKTAALPQLKLGWIVIRGPEAFRVQARQRLELIADTYLSVSTPAQRAAPRLLELRFPLQAQILSRLRENLEYLRKGLQDGPADLLPVEAGWTTVIRVPRVRSEEEWALELLAGHGVLVHPGYFYEFQEEAFLVVGLLPRPDDFREGVDRLTSALLETARRQ